MSAVVIAGQFSSAEPGSTAKLLGPRAYQLLPAGLRHTTECGAGADCAIFVCGPAPFDLVEEKPTKK